MTKLVEEMKPSLLHSETEAVESVFSKNGVFELTEGDDQ